MTTTHICQWPGCRKPDLTAPRPARNSVNYEIRSGRTEAGRWEPRVMDLCDEHLIEFKAKYMSAPSA